MLRFIDLFAGCGGLSEGFISEGFSATAHIEMDKLACRSLQTRMAYHYLKSRNKLYFYHDYLKGVIGWDQLMSEIPEDVSRRTICKRIDEISTPGILETIDTLANGDKVDVIIGGPPCQAYSLVGRSRDANRMVNDSRNYLYKNYLSFVSRYKPEYVVLENVTGLKTASNYLKQIISMFEDDLGYNTAILSLDAADYGVLQRRKRVIIVGAKSLDPNLILEKAMPAGRSVITDLFCDLPALKPGDALNIALYTQKPTQYLEEMKYRIDTPFVTQHICRPHNERDLEIYRLAIEKWLKNRVRLNYNELPEHLKTHRNRKGFLDRFKVVDPYGLSHTMVAHISKDGHHYIYPSLSQVRSISVREAARIQSFPDNYFFEGGRTAAFRQIGNAVPPLLAKALANAIKRNLGAESPNGH